MVEKNHFFEKKEQKYFRSNELHRKVIDKSVGDILHEEFIVKNYSEVKYVPSKEKLEATSSYVEDHKG